MSEPDDRYDKLRRRIAELEQENRRLRRQLGDQQRLPPGSEQGWSDTSSSRGPNAAADGEPPPWSRIEWWVEKIGITLLILGLGLFIYLAVDRGWMSPVAAVWSGLAAGTGLAAGGWFINEDRRTVGQLLMGAGSIALYLTLYAAYGLFELIPYTVAFGAMTGVVAATFLQSYLERLPAIAALGAVGGFATPVLVSTGGNIPGLMTYTAVLVAGMSAIYLVRGWHQLLALSAVGGWLFATYAGLEPRGNTDQWFSQLGVLVVWLCVGVVPTVRCWLQTTRRDPQQIPTRLAAVLALVSGGLGLWLTLQTWAYPGWLVIVAGLALAVGSAAVAYRLTDRFEDGLVSAYRILVPVGLTAAMYQAIPDGHFSPFLVLIAVATHFAAAQYSDRALRHIAHLLVIPAALKLIGLMFGIGSVADVPFLSLQGVECALVVAGFFIASLIIRDHTGRKPYRGLEYSVYRWTAHTLVLVYIAVELRDVADAVAFITIGWAMYAMGLLVAGVLNDVDRWKRAGLVVVMITVGKLLFIDMQMLDLVWRILLFCGFGAALLAVHRFTPAFETGGGTDDGSQSTSTGN